MLEYSHLPEVISGKRAKKELKEKKEAAKLARKLNKKNNIMTKKTTKTSRKKITQKTTKRVEYLAPSSSESETDLVIMDSTDSEMELQKFVLNAVAIILIKTDPNATGSNVFRVHNGYMKSALHQRALIFLANRSAQR